MKKQDKEEEPKKVEPTFTPLEYRDKFCLASSRVWGGGRSTSAEFAVADTLYKWGLQAHHYGADSFKLTEAQFRKALDAAGKFPCVAPFADAVPFVIKDKFKAFKPKKG